MKCFEVTINGERVCTAGVGDDGVLTTILSFVRRPEADGTGATESLDVRVGGLANRDGGLREQMEWLRQDLQVGDEVVIRVIEAAACDEAANKEETYLECSFCGNKQADANLIAGPHVFICYECVRDSNEVLASGEPTGNISIVISKTSDERCSFCGRKWNEVIAHGEIPRIEKIVGAATARICNECIKICNHILTDRNFH